MELNRWNIVQRQCQLSVSHVGKEKNDVMYCVLGNLNLEKKPELGGWDGFFM